MFQQFQAAMRKRISRAGPGGASWVDSLLRVNRAPPAADGCWWHQDAWAMDAPVTLDLWADDQRDATHAAADVLRVFQRADECLNAARPFSEAARVNRDAPHGPVPVSEELFKLLQRALKLSQWTRGAFDITYVPVARPRRVRGGRTDLGVHAGACNEVLPGIGCQHIELDEWSQTVRFTHRDTRIDLSGLARAHAVDQAALRLKRQGIAHAFLSLGGDCRVVGDRRGRPWSLGVRDPRADDEWVAALPLADVAVSVSSDHEQTLPEGPGRVQRVIDPRTGLPVPDAASVTVLAGDGVTAEAVAKMLLALGPQMGLARSERLPGVEALVVSPSGELLMTSGLALHHASELGRPVDRSPPGRPDEAGRPPLHGGGGGAFVQRLL
jgi:FAD:protein FMN transferase